MMWMRVRVRDNWDTQLPIQRIQTIFFSLATTVTRNVYNLINHNM